MSGAVSFIRCAAGNSAVASRFTAALGSRAKGFVSSHFIIEPRFWTGFFHALVLFGFRAIALSAAAPALYLTDAKPAWSANRERGRFRLFRIIPTFLGTTCI
jgi:hypothetical protein